MARSFNDIAGRITATLFVLALFALVVFFALQLIPKAERPQLDRRPGTSVVSHSP